MKNKMLRLFSVVMILAMLLPVTAFGQAPEVVAVESEMSTTNVRYIVQLKTPALLEQKEFSILGDDGKYNVTSFSAQMYINELESQQATFTADLERVIPGAGVAQYVDESGVSHDLAYQVAFNGLTVTLPDASRETLKQLAQLPNVKLIFPEQERAVNMDASLPLIGLGDPAAGTVVENGLWDLVGGPEEAGKDIKVAVVDTGVDIYHDFFDPTGFSYPAGYPKGNTSYTTPKVIVSRGYYRAFDPPVYNNPLDHNGHGSHTSGTIAGNYGTVATIGTLTQTVSGVAPQAQVMNYQIFYLAQSGSESAWDPEILMALEDLVLDGADVTNNSWGGVDNKLATADPIAAAFQNITDAGIVAVKSAGNSGRGAASVDTLSALDDLISVGASTTSRNFGNALDVTAPVTDTIPMTVTNILATEAAITDPITETFGPEPYVYVGRLEPSNFDGCDPFVSDLTGVIALISRGSCNFSDKIANAQTAGAIGVVVFNNVPGAPPIVMGGTDVPGIPGFMVGNEPGLALVEWDAKYPDEGELQIGYDTARIPDAKPADIIADFSGTGPNIIQGIGPHIVAPGVDILSAGADNSWMAIQGTSMAAPHVAGSAALLRQLYPDWTVTEVKSALMTKAKVDGLYNDYSQTDPAMAMDRGAGRLDLSDMGAVDFFVAPQAASFGQVMVTDTVSLPVDVWADMASDSYTISVQELVTETGYLTVTVDSSTVVALTSGTTQINLTVETKDATPGDYEGLVWFENAGGEMYHIPYWVRVKPQPTADYVLLLQDDSSIYGPAYGTDVLDVYTQTLENLGYMYDVWNVDLWEYFTGSGLPPVSMLQEYDKIIWFTGDGWLPYLDTGATVDDRWAFLDYLNSSDAKVFVTGEDFSGYHFAGDPDQPLLGYTGFGAWPEEDVFCPHDYLSPYVAAEGLTSDPAFAGVTLDLGYSITDTLSYECYTDELYAESGQGGEPFIRSLMPGAVEDGYLAIKRSAEPSLENEGVLGFNDYRTLYLGFGFENIINDSGYTTREEFLSTAFDWFDDRPEVDLTTTDTSVSLNNYTYFTATLTSNLMGVDGVSYRWDFGDGSAVVESDGPVVMHQYTEIGYYTVMVEVTDSLGHKAVTELNIAVGSILYLPLINR